jgi:hypothetical protein
MALSATRVPVHASDATLRLMHHESDGRTVLLQGGASRVTSLHQNRRQPS